MCSAKSSRFFFFVISFSTDFLSTFWLYFNFNSCFLHFEHKRCQYPIPLWESLAWIFFSIPDESILLKMTASLQQRDSGW